MPLLSSQTTYTFTPTGGTAVTFNRRLAGDTFTPWFTLASSYVKDEALDGGVGYLDVGAYRYPPLEILAHCASTSERATLKSQQRLRGTLSNSRGRSATVMLVSAEEVESADGVALLACTFEKVG
jgi:hypothetical protein